MNRVFSPEPSIEVEVVDTGSLTTASAPMGTASDRTPQAAAAKVSRAQPPSARPVASQQQRATPLATFAVMTALMAASAVAGLGLWSQHQQALQQERNMLLIERLRNLGSTAEGTAATGVAPGSDATTDSTSSDLPPPPPNEPWMEELASLPSSSAPAARVLKVPMSNRVQTAAPAAQASSPSRPASDKSDGSGNDSDSGAGALPNLVGVIQIPGRGGSAIFQLNGNSTSAAVGESIGSSGWRLQSASGDSAVIERGGEQRRLSITSGF